MCTKSLLLKKNVKQNKKEYEKNPKKTKKGHKNKRKMITEIFLKIYQKREYGKARYGKNYRNGRKILL